MVSRGRPLALILAVVVAAAARALAAEPPISSIFVVTHHWHTGIVARAADVPPGRWPDAEAFAGAEFVEVGWGDRDFWMAPRETIGLALQAALLSEASALRVLWFDGPVERSLPASDVVELAVSRAGLAALVDFVAESYARTPAGRPIDLGPGPLPGSRFYLATGALSPLQHVQPLDGPGPHSCGAAVRSVIAHRQQHHVSGRRARAGDPPARGLRRVRLGARARGAMMIDLEGAGPPPNLPIARCDMD